MRCGFLAQGDFAAHRESLAVVFDFPENRIMSNKQFGAGLLCGIVLAGVCSSFSLFGKVVATEPKAEAPLLYELRTYTTPEGKLDALNARFRDHTMQLFEKHGMKNIIYWTPADKPNTLVYVIAHKDADAAKVSWDAFRNDPVWKKVAEETQRDGKIVSKVEAVYLNPTDYSPMK